MCDQNMKIAHRRRNREYSNEHELVDKTILISFTEINLYLQAR